MKIAICDDEAYMRVDLEHYIRESMERRKISPEISLFEDGERLLASKHDWDLLFLDVQMESPDGLETARRLRADGWQGFLIFVTVLKERVFESFEVGACDYLLKPLEPQHFERALSRILKELGQETTQFITIQRGNLPFIIYLKQIVYCEVIGRKIHLHSLDGESVEFYERMERLETRLDERFFRCHRSYLVNLDYVREHREGQLFLAGGGQIPVSRLRERNFIQALMNRMKGRGA